MAKNPYLALYKMMGEATKVENPFFIAKIRTPLPNIAVQINDIILEKDDLLIDTLMLEKNELKNNDKVVLLRIEDKFILMSKVVEI